MRRGFVGVDAGLALPRGRVEWHWFDWDPGRDLQVPQFAVSRHRGGVTVILQAGMAHGHGYSQNRVMQLRRKGGEAERSGKYPGA